MQGYPNKRSDMKVNFSEIGFFALPVALKFEVI
jgi:hypothetical protein